MNSGLLAWEGSAYPSLQLKAWNGRVMTAFFAVVLKALDSREGVADGDLKEEVKLASAATTAIASFLHSMETSPWFLTADQANSMRVAVETYLNLIQVLALLSHRRQKPRWKCVPKHHSMVHLIEDQSKSLINMRAYHTFLDEDFVGVFKALAQQVPKELLEYRCMTRYLLRLKATPA